MSTELAVQCAKLPEWLLARRAVPEAYARLLPGLEAKVAEALAEPVSDKAANELIAQHREAMTYFTVKAVYEAVAKSPEGQAKSLLGAHTHPGAAKWKAALDAFRRKNLGWISVARILIQNVSYEIPALKKHATACERQVQECSQRQAELLRAEANAKGRHEKLLAELGVLGLDPRRELRAGAEAELPRMRSELVELLQSSGRELLDYYGAFAAHAAEAPEASEQAVSMLRVVVRDGQRASVEDVEQEVPSLRALREEAVRSGASSKRAAATPSAREASAAAAQAAPEPAATEDVGGISWGLGPAESGASSGGGGIDWDFEVSGGGSAGGGIDWGIEVSGGGEQVAEMAAPEAGAAGGGIDWGGISFEGLELGTEGSAEGSGAAATAAAGGNLLSDPQARELLYQDVAEVGAFLQVRCSELSRSSTTENGPKDVDKSIDEVKALADITNKAEELMAGRKTQRLLMLESSDRYLDQQVKRIEVSKAQCQKPVAQRAALEKAKAEQLEEAKRTYAEVDKLRKTTHQLQRELEAELSAHFKAAVRIVGEISQI